MALARCLLPHRHLASHAGARLTTRRFSAPASSRSSNQLHLIILGAPGSGKGTQGERLLKKYELAAVGVGDLLRQEVSRATKLGNEVEKVMKAGGLLPDEIVLSLIEPEVKALNNKSWILDGFPRKASQAALLDEILGKGDEGLNLVVNLAVPDEVILARIEARWIHQPSQRTYNTDFNPPKVPGKDDITGEPLTKRPDDNADTFKRRLDSYHRENNPLLDYYRDAQSTSSQGVKMPKLVTLSGRTSNEIWPKLERLVQERFPNLPLRS